MRWTLVYSITEGERVRLSLDRFNEGRNFVTKLFPFGEDAIETVNCSNGIIANNVVEDVGVGADGVGCVAHRYASTAWLAASSRIQS